MAGQDILDALREAVGPERVLTGDDAAPWASDWTGKYASTPLAVVRPANTAEVSAVLAAANAARVPVVPLGGNSGLTGAGQTNGGIVLSLDRMNAIREVRPEAGIAIVEAGVILDHIHEGAADHDLIFPLTFGARGTARVGGFLGTNAGGSNVLRYGNTRDLVLGIEAVLADGRVMNLMTELHKDNSGYDLRDLIIGAEGTLAVVTAAVLKLFPRPHSYAAGYAAVPDISAALALLNRLQRATGGAVEAFEYMPRRYLEIVREHHPDRRQPFAEPYPINIFVDLGETDRAGSGPAISEKLEAILAEAMEEGQVLDAVIAQNETQRADFWFLREVAGEITFLRKPFLNLDLCLPLDRVQHFIERMEQRVQNLDPGAEPICVAHLGDGNVHNIIYPTKNDPALLDGITEAVEDLAFELGGSFSAEHGVGLSKLGSMARRKDPVALDVMRSIKAALDPNGILNPGKVLPPG